MLNLIERLRDKPDKKKKQIAFLVSFFLAGIIFVVWLTVIFPDFRKKQTEADEISRTEQGPTSSLANIFSVARESIDGQFGKIRDFVSNLSSNETYYVSTSTEPVYPQDLSQDLTGE